MAETTFPLIMRANPHIVKPEELHAAAESVTVLPFRFITANECTDLHSGIIPPA